MNDLNKLRDHLFGTLDALRNEEKPMPPAQARAIVDVAQALIDTAKVEVEFLRATGQEKGSGFIPEHNPQLSGPTSAPGRALGEPRLVRGRDASGSR